MSSGHEVGVRHLRVEFVHNTNKKPRTPVLPFLTRRFFDWHAEKSHRVQDVVTNSHQWLLNTLAWRSPSFNFLEASSDSSGQPCIRISICRLRGALHL